MSSAVQLALDIATPWRTWAQARVGDRYRVWVLLGGRRELVCTVAELVQVPGAKEWIVSLQPEDGSPPMHDWRRWNERLPKEAT